MNTAKKSMNKQRTKQKLQGLLKKPLRDNHTPSCEFISRLENFFQMMLSNYNTELDQWAVFKRVSLFHPKFKHFALRVETCSNFKMAEPTSGSTFYPCVCLSFSHLSLTSPLIKRNRRSFILLQVWTELYTIYYVLCTIFIFLLHPLIRSRITNMSKVAQSNVSPSV